MFEEYVFAFLSLLIVLSMIILFLGRNVLRKCYKIYKDRGIGFVTSKIKEKVNFIIISKGWINVNPELKSVTKTITINPFSGKVNIHEVYENRKLRIAFYPTGGMGDYIISAVILEELQQICNCHIDVYAEKLFFGHTIYDGRNNVTVLEAKDYELNIESYDLALKVEHFIHITSWKKDRLLMISKELYYRVLYIKENWNELYVDIPQQCWRERIQFERCRLLGLNRWTELRMGKAFDVKRMKVSIPINPLYEQEFEDLKLSNKKYITINYGADAMKIGMKQLKLWSKDYLVQLVSMIKEKYHGVNVVQLGDANAEKIPGVDVYVLGKSIEVTKYIIRESACHVDCEGGLVHLAAQFDTRSVVIFGPTPLHMYGYPQNINLVSDKCSNCMGLHDDWAYKCYCGYNTSRCMEDITPSDVMDAIEKVFRSSSEG